MITLLCILLALLAFAIGLARWPGWIEHDNEALHPPTEADRLEALRIEESLRVKRTECGDADTAWMSAHSNGWL